MQQGQLASCNLPGVSYFGRLGRNILYNVSFSQGSKFLRPPAVPSVPCFYTGRIGTYPSFGSPIRSKLRASQTYFQFSTHPALCVSLLFCPPQERRKKVLSLRLPPGAALKERIALSLSFSVFWSFLGCFWKPCFVTFDGFLKVGNLNFFGENGNAFLHLCFTDMPDRRRKPPDYG